MHDGIDLKKNQQKHPYCIT